MSGNTRAYRRRSAPPSTTTTIRMEKALIEIARNMAEEQKVPLAVVYNGLMWIGYAVAMGWVEEQKKSVDNEIFNLYLDEKK